MDAVVKFYYLLCSVKHLYEICFVNHVPVYRRCLTLYFFQLNQCSKSEKFGCPDIFIRPD